MGNEKQEAGSPFTAPSFTHPKLATQIISLLVAHAGLFRGRETEWTIEELANNFRVPIEAVVTTALEMRENDLYPPYQNIVEGGYSEPWDEDTYNAFKKWVDDNERHLAGG